MRASEQVGLRSRLEAGITWNTIAAVFTLGGNFLTNILFANILGRDVFGEYGMIQSTVLAISGIAQLATGYTATKYVAEYRLADRERTGRILGLCSTVATITALLAAVALFFGAPWLAAHTLKAPRIGGGLMIAAGFVLFSVINGYQAGALAGLEGYRPLAVCSIALGCITVGIGSLGAWLWGLEGAIASLAVGSLLRWLLFHRVLKAETVSREIDVRFDGISRERGIISRFAIPTAIAGFSSMPALWLSNAFLVRQQDGYSQMGLYASANNLKSLVLFLPLIVNTVSMSLINSQKGVGDERRYRKVFWTNLALTAGVTLAGGFLVAVSGKWLLRMYGKDFIGGDTVLLYLMGATVFEAVTMASYQIVQCQERMWLSFFAITLPRDLIIVLLAYLLTPLYGALGLAIAYTGAQATSFLATLVIISLIGLNTQYEQKVTGIVCDVNAPSP